MTGTAFLTGIIVFLCCLVFMLTVLFRLQNNSMIQLSKKIEELNSDIKISESKRKSTEVRTGQLIEKWIPFIKDLGIEPTRVKFLGDPIDYVVFNGDSIIFLEIKTGQSKLSKNQKNIKELIEEGKVSFKEVRIL